MNTKEALVEMTKTNNAFSKKTPGLQLTWDTGSTADIKTCPRLYYLKMIEGWTPKGENPHLLFGLITHSAIETYDRAIIKKKSHEESLRLAVRHVFEKTARKIKIIACEECGAQTENLETPICMTCNSNQILPREIHSSWRSDHKNKNLYTLLRTVVWYLDHYKDSKEIVVALADGSPAVEIWSRFIIPQKTKAGESFTLSCHLDKIVSFGDGHWFKDIKTTKNTISWDFFSKFALDNQMSFYTIAGAIVFEKTLLGGIIDGMQVAIGFSRFQRGMVQRTRDQSDEWLFNLSYWLRQAEAYALEGFWPMNDTACNHYGGCDFKGVCSKDPSSRTRSLETHFKRQVWDPTKERT